MFIGSSITMPGAEVQNPLCWSATEFSSINGFRNTPLPTLVKIHEKIQNIKKFIDVTEEGKTVTITLPDPIHTIIKCSAIKLKKS